jgi:hypothetical protein
MVKPGPGSGLGIGTGSGTSLLQALNNNAAQMNAAISLFILKCFMFM